jgi:hypothetical protein
MISIFTTPKPFQGHINIIQRNAIQSWTHLGQDFEVLLIGEENGMAAAARDLDVRHIEHVERNANGTPLISSIFSLARQHARHSILCYVNADVILLPDLIPVVHSIAETYDHFLIAGQRWDLDLPKPLDFDTDWEADLRRKLSVEGKLHPPAGSDYFVFRKDQFKEMPQFALGRAGWDNWMIYAGRHNRSPVIDATRAVTIIHQQHDYAHLPGGRPHYRLPESSENVVLAGGWETMFRLGDADWKLNEQGLVKKKWGEAGFRRNLETSGTAWLGSGPFAKVLRMIMHPLRALEYFYLTFKDKLKGTNLADDQNIARRGEE